MKTPNEANKYFKRMRDYSIRVSSGKLLSQRIIFQFKNYFKYLWISN
jgi:hypothetical protein